MGQPNGSGLAVYVLVMLCPSVCSCCCIFCIRVLGHPLSVPLILINSLMIKKREYYTDSRILWEELDSLRPIPTCFCSVKCTYKLFKTILEYEESDRVMSFLKCPRDTYNSTKTQIFLMEPLPGINKVFSLALQQEKYIWKFLLESSMQNQIKFVISPNLYMV